MTRPSILILSFFLATLLGAGCNQTPEGALTAALDSLCQGDKEAFSQQLTPESRRLFAGLDGLAADRFTCTAQGFSGTLVDTGVRREGLRVLRITDEAPVVDVALVRQDGRWLIDLFATEESLFYTRDSGGE